MKANLVRTGITLACSLVLSVAPAFAHSVWIEDTAEQKLMLRFGELGEELEKSPGRLDSFLPVVIWSGAEDLAGKLFEAQKKGDGFLLPEISAGKAAFAETGFPLRAQKEKRGTRSLVYARWNPDGTAVGAPAFFLDIVPTGKPGEARVYFQDKPLGGAKLALLSPGEKEREITADGDGFVRIQTVKSGLYILACEHQRQAQTGYFGGQFFDAVSHSVTLAWRQP